MVGENEVRNIGFLSTYSPRECGLATFTEDLVSEISKIKFIRTSVIAVVETPDNESYEKSPVRYQLQQHNRENYSQAALWANTHLDLLVIEHEYGIFGGDCGEYILDLAKELKIPFIVTTHTVLLEPSQKQQTILRRLGKLSTKIVTMAVSSIPILIETYGVAATKIDFIPHGVPRISLESRENLKIAYSLKNKKVISSFGLISPAKGLEYGIEAVAKVAADCENLVYLILGKTHPSVKARMGEKYRQSLMDLAQSLGVGNNVRFINKYLTKEEVMTYLHMSDMYLTPYLSKEQAVSGTLAYAMGCGRVIISTKYRYAEEMLGNGRGLLAEFKDANSIAGCIRTLIENPDKQTEMERKTLAVGRKMTWSIVANQYARLVMKIIPTTRPLLPNVHSRIPIMKLSATRPL